MSCLGGGGKPSLSAGIPAEVTPLVPQELKDTWGGGMLPVPRILLEWLSVFKLEYCRLIVGSERKIMSRGTVLHGFSVFE